VPGSGATLQISMFAVRILLLLMWIVKVYQSASMRKTLVVDVAQYGEESHQ
jgi:hypothetical protein